jgi:hypothetical protein
LNLLTAKRYGPFIDPKAGGLQPQLGSGGWVSFGDPSNPVGPVQNGSAYGDTFIPEFMDAYPDALPILYLRAVPSATGSIIGAQDQATSTVTNPPIVAAGNAAYDPSMLQPYLFPAYAPGQAGSPAAIDNSGASQGAGIGPGYTNPSAMDPQVLHDFVYNNGSPTPPYAPQYYFGLSNAPSQPRNKAGYLLITAGLDRKFMTADDMINGSRAQ